MGSLPEVLPGLHLNPRSEIHNRIIQYAVLILNLLISASSTLIASINDPPEPYHTSSLSGEAWVIELLTGHPERIHCELGMHAEVFAALISELRDFGYSDSKFISLEEQLAIFLYTSVTGLSIRHVGERFQRSNDTISRYFRQMVTIFSSPPFYSKYVRFPDGSVHQKIRQNAKFWPFFKDAIGALDGSHINVSPPASKQAAYRDRKGVLSQNCLFACDFDMKFTYALTGWEGSATDARVYEYACDHDFHIPAGKYFLADAGFPSRPGLLIPYRGVRYHLAEWGRANIRPANKKELFNLRHSSARNVIERIFGVLKHRFRILLLSPGYSLHIQARIPVALCTIHNFIRIHDPAVGLVPNILDDEHADDDDLPADDSDDHSEPFDDDEIPGLGVEAQGPLDNPLDLVQDRDDADIVALRDRIAEEMWVDYQRILQERQLEDESESEGSQDFDSEVDERADNIL